MHFHLVGLPYRQGVIISVRVTSILTRGGGATASLVSLHHHPTPGHPHSVLKFLSLSPLAPPILLPVRARL